MARGREPLGPTQWVIDSDETTLVLYVSVTQTLGTHARVTLEQHHLRDDARERVLASFRGDSRENGLEQLLRVAGQLLDTSRAAENLRFEREIRSN